MPHPIGVLAVQGDFEKHVEALSACNRRPEVVEVRTVCDLARVGRLVIPGGESTTVGLLLERYGLGEEIRKRAEAGMPVWGTCMGMILMAAKVQDRQQYSLDLLDITVERNAFGAQVHSFEDEVKVQNLGKPLTAVFIRAPIVTKLGEDVEVLAKYQNNVVAVKQGNRVGTSFHPEITGDRRFHEWFLNL